VVYVFDRPAVPQNSAIDVGEKIGDSSLLTTGLKGDCHTNPKRERGIPQVPCGATPVPSLTLRVSMGGGSRAEMEYRCLPTRLVVLSEECQLFRAYSCGISSSDSGHTAMARGPAGRVAAAGNQKFLKGIDADCARHWARGVEKSGRRSCSLSVSACGDHSSSAQRPRVPCIVLVSPVLTRRKSDMLVQCSDLFVAQIEILQTSYSWGK
jgi:hypothetical protein